MKIALIGPVYPFRAGIAHCTTRFAEKLENHFDLRLISFKRQYPAKFYPGKHDVDSTLRDRVPQNAQFLIDVLNPISWIRVGRMLRHEEIEVLVLVWWVWIWAIPYLVIRSLAGARVVLQCHNVADKEPAWWKSALTNLMLRRADQIVVHAGTEAEKIRSRIGERVPVHQLFLPVHQLGGEVPSRDSARQRLGIGPGHVALLFGHIRPFKGLDVALKAWSQLKTNVLLIVAGEIWWDDSQYRRLVQDFKLEDKVLFHTRFVPDDEVATYFAAADVVLAPYLLEAQSGVVMTAFHFARPVIATRVGGIPEVVRDSVNGYLIPAGDPAALATAVDRFFLRDRFAMGEAAADSVRDLSWTRYVEEFQDIILAAVSS